MAYREESFASGTMPLSDGLAGTEETVAVMQRLALQGAALPRVREQAERIIRGLPARDWGAEARCLAAWVKRHMRYTRDGLTIETIKTVPRMLDDIEKYGAALLDCDDAAVLLGSLLLTIGHAPAYQLLGRGEIPHHVNVLDRTSGMELDPTGEPRGVFRFRRVYPLPMEG